MKHFTHLLLIVLGLVLSITAIAQPQLESLPIDPKVRYGKLSNGLTYYIRHNTEPNGQADFFIAQKVGSMQEEESQRGLAHFLEHMAFNGTVNLPDKMLLNYLETIGVKFGYNLNAYTSFDETVYNISNVPVSREGIIDTCLLILHDWSAGIALLTKNIDEERGVIREEWRTGQGADMRMWETLLPEMYPGNRYGERLPIGLIEVIDNFKPEEIREYYKKWYRPDLQAVIIVGDIDVDQIERKIHDLFSDIPAPVDPAERVYFPVSDNDEPIVSIATDPEATNTIVMLFYKHDDIPENLKPTMLSLVVNYMTSVTQSMINDRLNELLQQADPPFVYAEVYDNDFFVAKTKKALMGVAIVKEGDIDEGLGALVREMERMKRFGFTPSEYERAKSNFLRSMENLYNERDKQKSLTYAREYVRHFEDAETIAGIEYEYNFYNMVAPTVTLEQINEFAATLVGDKNIVIGVTGPQKEGLLYPTKAEILNVLNKTKAEEITAYTETVSDEPLITQAPKAGKIVKETTDKTFGTTVWTLSNGAKVVIKKTDFKEDQVLFKATSPGGNSLMDDVDITNTKVMDDVVELGGLGAFSRTDLQKVMAGKRASVSASVTTTEESLSGSCSPKDMETMMQLIYLSFTAPRTDDAAFQSFMVRKKAELENAQVEPMTAFMDSLTATLYANHPRSTMLKLGALEEINYQRIVSLYKDRFGDAGDFVFTFVGNVDISVMKPLVEEYIASLPVIKRKESYKDIRMNPVKGQVKNYFEREMGVEKSTVASVYTGDMHYNLENIVKMSVLSQILDLVYTERIREEEGGTYGVAVHGEVSSYPTGRFSLMIYFDTNPDLRDKLIAKIHDEFRKIAQEGPSETNVNKVKEYMLKKHTEDLRENRYWLKVLDDNSFYGIDNLSDYVAIVNAITPASIRAFAGDIVSKGNNTEVVMTGIVKK
jgi:zinc protease